jgi:hypothetical protein
MIWVYIISHAEIHSAQEKTMNKANRYERTAANIAADFGVHVEWAAANREYVVETVACGTAHQARVVARKKAREFAAAAGAGNSYKPKLYP